MGLESLIPPRQKDLGIEQAKKPSSPPIAGVSSTADSSVSSPGSEFKTASIASQAPNISSEDSAWPHKEEPPRFPKYTESFRDKFNTPNVPPRPTSDPHHPLPIFHIEVEKIKPNPYQPRKQFDEYGLRELAQSIREFGVIQPIVVSKITRESERGADVEYELLAGERRLMAAKLAGLPRIPAIVRNVDVKNRHEKLELALIENLQRHDLNPVDEARAYARLNEEFGLTQREIALRVGKSREVVANTMRFLGLSRETQDALALGKINQTQARSLLGIENIEARNRRFVEFIGNRSEAPVRKIHAGAGNQALPTPEEKFLERQLEEKLGAPVKIVRSAKGGKIIITFYSDEEKSGVLKNILG